MSKRKLNLCRVTDKAALEAAGIPWRTKTLREMRLRGEHPQIFIKIGHTLMIDLDAFDATILEPAISERDRRAGKIARASAPRMPEKRKRA